MKWLTESLSSQHKRNEFSCGKQMLDNYLQKQVNQDIKRKLAACFVLNDNETGLLIGYFTVANNSIPQELLPHNIRKKLPKYYTSIPTTLIGMLAIDKRFQGRGFGKYLLMDALKRSYEVSKRIGSFAVVVDPIDMDAEQFYENYGFIKLPDSGKMFLPMKTLASLF